MRRGRPRADVPASGANSRPRGAKAKPVRIETERGWKGAERRRQSELCLRWNETSESSGRSAMFIVQTVFRRHKLRQVRHGLEHRNYRSLPAKRAAPDGAWMASKGLGCYKHATPTKLVCFGPIPPEHARFVLGPPIAPLSQTYRRGQPLQSEAVNGKNAPESAIRGVRHKR